MSKRRSQSSMMRRELGSRDAKKALLSGSFATGTMTAVVGLMAAAVAAFAGKDKK